MLTKAWYDTTMSMKVVSANFYRGNSKPLEAARMLRDMHAHVVGVQEAVRRHRLIMTTMRKDYLGFAGSEDVKAGREVPVFLQKNEQIRYLGDGAYLVSDRVDPSNSGIAPDRFLTWVRFEFKGRKYCLINIHPNAVVQNKKTGGFLKGLKRVREYKKSMRQLEQEIKAQQNDGFAVLVTGDLNWRPIGQRVFKWSPVAVFERNGLEFVNVGVDYVAWQSNAFKMHGKFVIPKGENGSDHPWVGVNLRPAA